MTVRTRFAPSPTGYLHIGGARTALFSYLYARRHGGSFVLRIEDTDRERSTDESINAILEGMTWLGLDYDEGPHFQTRRFDRYAELIQRLLDEDKAYHCYCTREELDAMREQAMARKEKPRYDGRCRARREPRPGVEPVVRFRNPLDGAVVIDDLVRGRVVISNDELDDLIIARSDGTPTYNFTVVVDDLDMQISHVIRGDDHLNNTPRQINLLTALGGQLPAYAHVPMILGADGKRLSKRHGAVSVLHYRQEGYLPEALLNYLVRLGWSHGDQEVFSLDEMTQLFDIADVNASASTFNPEKLLWLNQQYIQHADPAHVARHLSEQFTSLEIDPAQGPELVAVAQVQATRCKTLLDMAGESRMFYAEFEQFEPAAAKKHLTVSCGPLLVACREALAALGDWTAAAIHAAVEQVVETRGVKFGKVAQPLRVAVSGGGVSPPIDATLWLLGRERTLARIDRALEFVAQRAAQGDDA